MAFEAGQSGLVVPVPEAEPVVGGYRARFDPAASAGVPAHVTVVYPFLPLADVTPGVAADLAAVVAAEPTPRVTFTRSARFPGVLYLVPEPDGPFRRLTRAIAGRWPEALPYDGQYGDDPTPHLTVTQSADDAEQDVVEAELAARLPFTARPAALALVGYDGTRWTVRHRFDFGPGQPAR